MKKNSQPKQVFLHPEPSTAHPPRLVVRCSEQDFYFNHSDIICIEADGPQAYIYTRPGSVHEAKIVVCKTLKQLEELLPPALSLRTHKSWLVNLQYVAGHKKGESHALKLSTGQLAPIAIDRIKEILDTVERFDISGFNK